MTSKPCHVILAAVVLVLARTTHAASNPSRDDWLQLKAEWTKGINKHGSDINHPDKVNKHMYNILGWVFESVMKTTDSGCSLQTELDKTFEKAAAKVIHLNRESVGLESSRELLKRSKPISIDTCHSGYDFITQLMDNAPYKNSNLESNTKYSTHRIMIDLLNEEWHGVENNGVLYQAIRKSSGAFLAKYVLSEYFQIACNVKDARGENIDTTNTCWSIIQNVVKSIRKHPKLQEGVIVGEEEEGPMYYLAADSLGVEDDLKEGCLVKIVKALSSGAFSMDWLLAHRKKPWSDETTMTPWEQMIISMLKGDWGSSGYTGVEDPNAPKPVSREQNEIIHEIIRTNIWGFIESVAEEDLKNIIRRFSGKPAPSKTQRTFKTAGGVSVLVGSIVLLACCCKEEGEESERDIDPAEPDLEEERLEPENEENPQPAQGDKPGAGGH